MARRVLFCVVSYPGSFSLAFTRKSLGASLVPRPSIPNAVEGLVKLVRRMTSGGRLEAWLTHRGCIALQFTGNATPPDVHLMSFYVQVLPGLPLR